MKRYITELPFPFSKAISAGGFLFLSGQVAMSEQGEPIYGDVKSQTRHVMESIKKTLLACGSDLNSVIKVTVWLSDMKHFAAFNEQYASFFSNGFPARSVVSCKLAFDLDVEIEVQALLNSEK